MMDPEKLLSEFYAPGSATHDILVVHSRQVTEKALDIARKEAEKWNITDIKFRSYDGDLDIFPDDSFDIVFTKSVLVVVPDLQHFLEKISRKLRVNGRVVFLENARGNAAFQALRSLKHRKEQWDCHSANYFADEHVDLVRSTFDIEIMKKTMFPPVYLLLGRKHS